MALSLVTWEGDVKRSGFRSQDVPVRLPGSCREGSTPAEAAAGMGPTLAPRLCSTLL
jgi:hypothetical protein